MYFIALVLDSTFAGRGTTPQTAAAEAERSKLRTGLDQNISPVRGEWSWPGSCLFVVRHLCVVTRATTLGDTQSILSRVVQSLPILQSRPLRGSRENELKL
ncbi:unnamed protein product, partial [Laminaria digitata]